MVQVSGVPLITLISIRGSVSARLTRPRCLHLLAVWKRCRTVCTDTEEPHLSEIYCLKQPTGQRIIIGGKTLLYRNGNLEACRNRGLHSFSVLERTLQANSHQKLLKTSALLHVPRDTDRFLRLHTSDQPCHVKTAGPEGSRGRLVLVQDTLHKLQDFEQMSE
ncbi:hypothetical protein F2P81_022621 [Scophthalmus maximus]|uniref:Uncharacterized protein n=1 Tax=Scophthalmus maximus TaxID=52904 RepID=A0A6A4S256_SCOMX|nr:hypothetical protein F2P81_022621 [Scophthalmus maximus]